MIRILNKTCFLFIAIFMSVSAYAASGDDVATPVFKPCGNYGRLYDVKTVTTLEGTIATVEKVSCRRAGAYSIHLVVRQDKQSMPVYVGPAWYLDKQGIKLSEGDKLRITGSIITVNGGRAMLASEIGKGDQVLKLRDDRGFPLWSGRKGRW